MPCALSMDIKPYYTTIKEREPPANDTLDRHLLDVTCYQASKPHDFESYLLTNRRDTEKKLSCL